MVYDARNALLASSAGSSGSVPNLPSGVLDSTVATGEDRVTWQPTAEVRKAVVASSWQSPTSHGVMVAGVGLTATENRAATLRDWVALSWLLVELALTATITGAAVRHRRAAAT